MIDNPNIVEISSSRALIQAGWDDVPHISNKVRVELLASTEPHLREARSKGTPSLGSGAIYPLPEEDIKVPFFPIPAFWPRAYALDVGWNRTAGLWAAWDPETWTCYLYAEHYRGQAEPSIHAEAIKARGAWIKGVIDPAARGRSQKDGEQLLVQYQQLGLHVTPSLNAVDAGIFMVWTALSSGKLKVMAHLTNWFAEWRLYRRDEKGNIVKKMDHLMDDTRYIILSGRGVASTKPVERGFSPSAIGGDSRMGY